MTGRVSAERLLPKLLEIARVTGTHPGLGLGKARFGLELGRVGEFHRLGEFSRFGQGFGFPDDIAGVAPRTVGSACSLGGLVGLGDHLPGGGLVPENADAPAIRAAAASSTRHFFNTSLLPI